jgi:hypothetical protein
MDGFIAIRALVHGVSHCGIMPAPHSVRNTAPHLHAKSLNPEQPLSFTQHD